MVVGRWHVLDLEESEEVLGVAFRIGNTLAQILGVFLPLRLPAQRVEDTLKPGDVTLCSLESDASALAALIDAAADRKELPERVGCKNSSVLKVPLRLPELVVWNGGSRS